MIEFRSFDIKDKSLVEKHTLNSDFKNCDWAFANLFAWQFRYNTKIAFKGNCMYIKYNFHNKPYYMIPLGHCNLTDAIKDIIDCADKQNERICIQGVTEKIAYKIKEIDEQFSITYNRDYSDYLYLRSDLIELRGKKYQPKRNHINQFKKNYPHYKFVPITEEIIPECIELSSRWQSSHTSEKARLSLEAEHQAILNVFGNFNELKMTGGAILVDNKLVAFSYGSNINNNTFDVAVEKADAEYVGAYAIINQEFAKHIPEQFTFINREEDLGIEGLRKAKLSYHPIEIINKFTMKRE